METPCHLPWPKPSSAKWQERADQHHPAHRMAKFFQEFHGIPWFFQDLIGGYNMNQHDTTQLTQKSSPFRNHRPWCHDIPLAPPAYSSGISSNSPYKRSKPRAEDSRRIRSFSKREVHQIVMWILRSWLMLKTWILCPFCVSGLIQLQGFQGRKKSIFIGRFPFAIQCMLSSKAQMPPNIPWGPASKENMTLLICFASCRFQYLVPHMMDDQPWKTSASLQAKLPPSARQSPRSPIVYPEASTNCQRQSTSIGGWTIKSDWVNCDQHPWHWVPNCGFNHQPLQPRHKR